MAHVHWLSGGCRGPCLLVLIESHYCVDRAGYWVSLEGSLVIASAAWECAWDRLYWGEVGRLSEPSG